MKDYDDLVLELVKAAFVARPQDFLPLLGDRGGKVISVETDVDLDTLRPGGQRTVEGARSERGVKGFAAGRAEGLAAGRAEGQLEYARRMCLDFVARHRPSVRKRIEPMVHACADTEALTRWTLVASEGDGARLLRAVGVAVEPESPRPRGRRKERPRRSR